MRKFLVAVLLAATACGTGGVPKPAPPTEPTPDPQPQPPPSQPPPAQPPPSQPPPSAACFLEEGGHGDWAYQFTRTDGDCGPGKDFVSGMAPGTSFFHFGPTPEALDCQTRTNVVSSDHCQKNITRRCRTEEYDISLVAEFHQESPTRVAFTLDERWDAVAPYAVGCAGRYFGTLTQQ